MTAAHGDEPEPATAPAPGIDSGRWTRRAGGRLLHADSDEHVALIARTLGIDGAAWQEVIDGYCARLRPGRDHPAGRLAALAAAFRQRFPPAPLPAAGDAAALPCPICGRRGLLPVVARAAEPEVVYARCPGCDHLALGRGAATAEVYQRADYYQRRGDPGGAGYPDYAAERAYREAKGARLLAAISAAIAEATGDDPAHQPRSLLEVGSGFGYTRQAARSRGLEEAGVDPNPHAVAAAASLYGLATHCGTLTSALEAGAVVAGAHDLVLYQFVLEHLARPIDELWQARRALRPGGWLALLVPSATAVERKVFGGHYRSLRSDHPHLFSPRSLALALQAAGLAPVSIASTCSLHLLSGVLRGPALAALYRAGRGPDLLALARREAA